MFRFLRPLTVCLLASTLVLVQTALPWMHAGCRHEHGLVADAAGPHARCNHQHAEQAAAPRQATVGHDHSAAAHGDCAACRLLLQPPLVVAAGDAIIVEAASPLDERGAPIVASPDRYGIYQSRAPPAQG